MTNPGEYAFPFPKPVCQHIWQIETANGPTSKGVCSLCGTKRLDFRNYLFYESWYEHSKDTPENEGDTPENGEDPPNEERPR